MAGPDKPQRRILKVTGKRHVTKNMIRITLGGPGLDGFPGGQAGGYVKLRLPAPGDPEKQVVRTYTIRHQRNEELDIDFALHGDEAAAGPATQWAMTAQIGDAIELGGPGPAKPLPQGFDTFILIGDMTSLPAISVNLESLPADARGIALIEVMSQDDQQYLSHPPGFEVRWIINPMSGCDDAPLPAQAHAVSWPDGAFYVWCACEFSSMRALRAYLRDEQGLKSENLYISSYWKSGINEDAHKTVKRQDAVAEGQ